MTPSKLKPPHGLDANRLLAALPAEDRGLIEPHLRLMVLTRGRTLFDVGDDVQVTFFPCHTTVASIVVVSADGREIEVATIGREGAVGGIVSSGHKPAFGRAVVQTPGPAYAIATERLEAAKRNSPRLTDLFARSADILLAQVMQGVACNAIHDIEQRCCRWLLSMHDRAGDDIIRLTQQSLADMLGVQRTTVSAIARNLQAADAIRYRRGRIQVLHRDGLMQRSCECYRAVEDHAQRLLPAVRPPRAGDV